MIADTVFPYPGGKSRFASWILDQVPEHTCFVEVFGGAAGVLANEDPDTSTVEVYIGAARMFSNYWLTLNHELTVHFEGFSRAMPLGKIRIYC